MSAAEFRLPMQLHLRNQQRLLGEEGPSLHDHGHGHLIPALPGHGEGIVVLHQADLARVNHLHVVPLFERREQCLRALRHRAAPRVAAEDAHRDGLPGPALQADPRVLCGGRGGLQRLLAPVLARHDEGHGASSPVNLDRSRHGHLLLLDVGLAEDVASQSEEVRVATATLRAVSSCLHHGVGGVLADFEGTRRVVEDDLVLRRLQLRRPLQPLLEGARALLARCRCGPGLQLPRCRGAQLAQQHDQGAGLARRVLLLALLCGLRRLLVRIGDLVLYVPVHRVVAQHVPHPLRAVLGPPLDLHGAAGLRGQHVLQHGAVQARARGAVAQERSQPQPAPPRPRPGRLTVRGHLSQELGAGLLVAPQQPLERGAALRCQRVPKQAHHHFVALREAHGLVEFPQDLLLFRSLPALGKAHIYAGHVHLDGLKVLYERFLKGLLLCLAHHHGKVRAGGLCVVHFFDTVGAAQWCGVVPRLHEQDCVAYCAHTLAEKVYVGLGSRTLPDHKVAHPETSVMGQLRVLRKVLLQGIKQYCERRVEEPTHKDSGDANHGLLLLLHSFAH
mmetsp:Transcript_44107/g.122684  ORF Transcript_44107/g.122684 Transcript_44107/m.122684 type:complete len:560 (-) Transcript_44107:31-1710(-)